MGLTISVKSRLELDNILKEVRGDAFGTFAATEFYRLYKKYVPEDSGTMYGTVQITPWKITHTSPYTKVSDYLNRGDVLVTKSKGHTVVVLSDGAKAKPRGDAPVVTIADGTWNVRAGAGTNYATVGKTVHGGEKYVISGRTSSGWVRIPAGWISPKAVKA